MSQELTDFVIETAAQYGIKVREIADAPNGGDVIFFDFPKVETGKKNPYFMVWTGDPTNTNFTGGYNWHLETGHHYAPKNAKERKAFPTTHTLFHNATQAEIKHAIADIANRIGT